MWMGERIKPPVNCKEFADSYVLMNDPKSIHYIFVSKLDDLIII